MYNFLRLCALVSISFMATITSTTGQDHIPATIYVYAYSWTPGFCDKQTYPGCLAPESYWETNFTIHGLWPQYMDNGYPDFCTTEPFDNSIPQQIGEDTMIQYWPDVKYSPSSSSYNSFWEHEWTRHGTCSGLTQLQYFNTALQLTNRIPTPQSLYDSIGGTMSADLLRENMGGVNYVALQCSNQVLNGAYTCWNQTNNEPTVQTRCPQSVIKEDTCTKSSDITIVDLARLTH